MNWLIGFLFTCFEFYAMFLVGFALFRYKYKRNMTKIIISALIIGIVSNGLDYFKIGAAIGLPIQMLLIALFTTLYMKKKLWTSFLMSVITYLIYGLIQTFIVFIYCYFNKIAFGQIDPYTGIAYTIQSLSIFSAISIASIVKLTNEGFALNIDKKIKINKLRFSNKVFLIIMFSVFLMHGLVFHLLLSNSMSIIYFIELFTFCILSSILMISLCYKRDKEEAGA